LFGHYDFGKPACPGDVLGTLIEGQQGGIAQFATTPTRQKALRKLGYLPSLGSGQWDVESRRALMAFQSASGLAPDGVWGKRTTAACIAALKGVRP